MPKKLTECCGCGEMLEDNEVTYCPICDVPICNTCLDEQSCGACLDE